MVMYMSIVLVSAFNNLTARSDYSIQIPWGNPVVKNLNAERNNYVYSLVLVQKHLGKLDLRPYNFFFDICIF